MEWSNNGHVTHVDDDYLQCDLGDFPERKIAHGEITAFTFQERRAPLGVLFIPAAGMLGLVVWLMVSALSKGQPITPMRGGSIALCTLMLVVYFAQRTWHLVRNKRRTMSLELSDGSSGVFIEIEDDQAFQRLKECLESNRRAQ